MLAVEQWPCSSLLKITLRSSFPLIDLPRNRYSHPTPSPTTPAICPASTVYQQSRPVLQHPWPMSTPSTSSAPLSSISTAAGLMPILPPISKPVFLASPTTLALWCISTDTTATPLRDLLRGGEFPKGSLCSRGPVSLAI